MNAPRIEIPESWRSEAPLGPYTSWKIGGPARYLSEPGDPSALASDLRAASDLDLPVFVLGGGSNILISDRGFPGLVIRYCDRSIRLQKSDDGGDSVVLRVGAQAPLAGTARTMAHRGLSGLEWAEGIPGTIGGAVVGNAGAYGGDMSGVLIRAEVLVNASQLEVWPVAKMKYAYRTSVLKELPPGNTVVVLNAEFLLHQDDPERLRRRIAEISQRRRATTPAGQSCGSVFRNPPGDSAGRLIDGCGLKGESHGGSRVASEHGNYMLDDGTSTAADVLALIRTIQLKVFQQTGIKLIPEIQFVGFEPEDVWDIMASDASPRGQA